MVGRDDAAAPGQVRNRAALVGEPGENGLKACAIVGVLFPVKRQQEVSAWNQAELNNDATAVQLLLADDFVMTTADGALYNKAQMVASVRDKSYKPEVLQSTGMEVHAHGSTAVVTGSYYEKGVDKGAPWERRGRFTDTWMFIDGRWQCVASHFSVKAK